MDNKENSIEASLNAEFLQTALRFADNDPNLQVTNCHLTPATVKGDNFLGCLYRAEVTTSRSDQRSVILKCMPPDEEKCAYIKQADLFEVEIEMYSKTLPKMYELVKQKCPSFKPLTPKFIYSNPEADIIVMDYLPPSRYKMAQRQKGLDLNHCEIVMKSLATFHAASAAVHSRDPSSMDSYPEGIFKEKTRDFLDVYFKSSIQFLKKEMQKWPEFCTDEYIKKLEHLESTWWEKLGPALSLHEGGFNVLNHGDLWVNNIMFSYSPSGEIEELKLVDLQNVCFTSPALDLIYFFYTSPSDEVRQKYFDHLIQIYHDALQGVLVMLDCDVKAPTLEELHQQVKERMSIALFAVICELPNILAEEKDVFELGDYFRDEVKETVNKAYGSAEYKRVVQRLLPIFVNSSLL